MKPMRLKAVLRETWRNVATGTSRCALIWLLLSICAVACMCADLTQMTGLIGDARKWEESGASTYAITLQGGIDGAACEGLRSANGVLGAAALRQSSDRVRIASLPATEIPTYEASAHVAQVFAATGIRKGNSGVIMSTAVARTYGAHAGAVLPLVGGTRMRVSATFNWPSDGRQPTYGYAIISPGNDTKAYDTCLVRAWPVPDDIESLLRVSIRADAESGTGAAASATSAGASGNNETPHAKNQPDQYHAGVAYAWSGGFRCPYHPVCATVDVRHRNGVGIRIGLHAQNRDSERVACGLSENRDAAAVVFGDVGHGGGVLRGMSAGCRDRAAHIDRIR